MAVFPSAAHLASWAGLCPGNDESAGKRKSSQTRKGNVHLKTALVEAANAASRKKGSDLKDKVSRLKVRRCHKRAILALGHKILVAAYHVLAKTTDYVDLGGAYLDPLNTTRVANQLKRRLERLGYDVALQKVEPSLAV
jgi:transposase